MWARFINAALGIWLMAAPAVLGYGKPAEYNDRIVGPVITTFAVIAMWQITRGLRWVNLPLGMWLVLAPFLLGYREMIPFWNDILVGLGVTTLSLVKGRTDTRFGGGWSALFCNSCKQDGGGKAG